MGEITSGQPVVVVNENSAYHGCEGEVLGEARGDDLYNVNLEEEGETQFLKSELTVKQNDS